jgi:hypothetical protein
MAGAMIGSWSMVCGGSWLLPLFYQTKGTLVALMAEISA